MAKATLRHATEADFIALTGSGPIWRCRAFAGELDDGRLLGIGGLAYLPDGTVAMFMKATDEAREHYGLFVHKAGKRAIRLAQDLGIPVVGALTEDNIPAAARWLERLGFKLVEKNGHEVWIWQNSQH